MPVVVFLDGGVCFSKTEEPGKKFAKSLAKTGGLVVVVPNYRVLGDNSENVCDSLLALQWLKTHVGWYGGDCENISAIGCFQHGESLLHRLLEFGQVKNIVKRVLFVEDERTLRLSQPDEAAIALLASPWRAT